MGLYNPKYDVLNPNDQLINLLEGVDQRIILYLEPKRLVKQRQVCSCINYIVGLKTYNLDLVDIKIGLNLRNRI